MSSIKNKLLSYAPWALGGLSLAAIAYGVARRIGPRGTPLIIYASAGSAAGEFATVAERLRAQNPEARVVGITSAAGVQATIANHTGPIGPLLLVGHGTTRRFFSNLGGLSPMHLAGYLRGKLASDAVIGLVGCRAGADPREPDWTMASYGPGGALGFAGLLRDALVTQGAPWGVEVRAHATAGHASANPAIRVFRTTRSMVGQAGLAVIDLKYGQGSWQNLVLRQRWVAYFEGPRAESYIGGGELA